MGYILIVHDEGEELELLKMYLSFHHYRIQAAYNVKEACSFFDKHFNCDLIITETANKAICEADDMGIASVFLPLRKQNHQQIR